MTTKISAELADAVHQELRAMKEEHDLTWSEFFGVLAALDGPPPDVAEVAREASESASGASSAAAAYGAAVYAVDARDDAPARSDSEQPAPEQPAQPPPSTVATTEGDPLDGTTETAAPLGAAGDDSATAPTAATDGGPPTAATDGDGRSRPTRWDAGLSEAEREVVEHLVSIVDDHGGAVSADQLDYSIPVGHLDVAFEDVAEAVAAHPDVQQLGEEVFAPA